MKPCIIEIFEHNTINRTLTGSKVHALVKSPPPPPNGNKVACILCKLLCSYLSYFKAMIEYRLDIVAHSVETSVRVPHISCRSRQQPLRCRLNSYQQLVPLISEKTWNVTKINQKWWFDIVIIHDSRLGLEGKSLQLQLYWKPVYVTSHFSLEF